MNSIRLKYSGGSLNRASSLRKDKEWLNRQFSDPGTLVLPVWNSKNLIEDFAGKKADMTFSRCTFSDYPWLIDLIENPIFLGLENETAIFAADVSHFSPDELAHFDDQDKFIDLRRSGPLLSHNDAAILAFARGMVYWNQQHRFCSRCGAKTENQEGGHLRICSNPDCCLECYPRTDPAVIMLVEFKKENQPTQCLLGRQKAWPKGVYSTLAGFVEPGESLEDAVAREVFEESGIIVENIKYISSQPWPFPASIMLGFQATAKSTKLQIDNDELEEARWFTAKQLKEAGEWNDDTASLRLSRTDSISRYLIDTWIAEQQHK